MSMIPAIALMLALTAFAHFLPSWTRRDEFFAITIEPEFRGSDAARRIVRLYRAILWGSSVLAVALVAATGLVETALIQVAGFFVGLLIARRQTASLAGVPESSVVEVDLSAPRERFPGGPLIPLLQFAALGALAFWASRHWDQLPARIPIHYGLHGADRWADRTPLGVYGFLAAQAGICLLLALTACGILHWSRRGPARPDAAGRDRRFREINIQMLLLIGFFPPAEAWITLAAPQAMPVWVAATLVVIAIYIARLVRILRSPIASAAGDGTPDRCWKLGMFYYNPSDPSIFVAKRFGIGYTVNFGNRWSWAILGVILIAGLTRSMLR